MSPVDADAARGSSEDRGASREIAVAWDGSAEAWVALETAIGLAERTSARLTVITCRDYSPHAFGAAWTVYTAVHTEDLEHDECERIQDRALARVPSALDAEGRIINGPPGRSIAEASSGFDLLVMGSRGHGPLGRTVLGSVASYVVNTAHCPVLIIPRGTDSDPFGFQQERRADRERV